MVAEEVGAGEGGKGWEGVAGEKGHGGVRGYIWLVVMAEVWCGVEVLGTFLVGGVMDLEVLLGLTRV